MFLIECQPTFHRYVLPPSSTICHWPGSSIYPISLSQIPLSLLLWTAHPPAIGPVPSLSSLIPYWSSQSTGLLYNQRSFRARLTHRPDDGCSMHLWNVGRHSIKNTAVHPRRFWASALNLPWLMQLRCITVNPETVRSPNQILKGMPKPNLETFTGRKPGLPSDGKREPRKQGEGGVNKGKAGLRRSIQGRRKI
jgi:hypothetical protein